MALQIVSAMQPFAQAGLVNLSKLAEYVLSQGFGVKDPGSFLQQAPQPQGPEGMPMSPDQAALEGQGMPPGMTPDDMAGMEAEQGGMEGLPPELMAALMAGQGGPPQAGPAQGGIEGLPPEILAALLGGQGLPPEAAAPPTQELPPELAGLPPELLQALLGGQ